MIEKTTVTMLCAQRGSQDGVTVEKFEAGETYTIEAGLAAVFVENDWAAEPEPEPEPEPETEPETKALGAAPENKAAAPEETKPAGRYAKHKSFGNWFVHEADGTVVSGPHKKAEIRDMGLID